MFLEEVLEKLVDTTILSAEVKDGGGLVPDEIRITTIDDDVFVFFSEPAYCGLRGKIEPYQEEIQN